jgi:hypothetical protein
MSLNNKFLENHFNQSGFITCVQTDSKIRFKLSVPLRDCDVDMAVSLFEVELSAATSVVAYKTQKECYFTISPPGTPLETVLQGDVCSGNRSWWRPDSFHATNG